jgi:hypothetical protein
VRTGWIIYGQLRARLALQLHISFHVCTLRGGLVGHLRPVFLGDDLFARQPIVAAIHGAGGNFILTCKSSSHKTIVEYWHGAELQEHRQTARKRGKSTTIYRWLNARPLRGTGDAIAVNWFSIEILNAKGKPTYYNLAFR